MDDSAQWLLPGLTAVLIGGGGLFSADDRPGLVFGVSFLVLGALMLVAVVVGLVASWMT